MHVLLLFPHQTKVSKLTALHTKPDDVMMNSYRVHISVEDTFVSEDRTDCFIKNLFSLNHVS